MPHESRLTRAALALLVLATCAVFLAAHWFYPGLPSVDETGGWRDWVDQGRYLRAAQAWQAGDLSAGAHWYPPGYPMMAALFSRITPHDRFLLPNLACVVISQMACAALAVRLFPGLRWARCIGALAFLVASVGTLPGLKLWLVPWTTTPATACILLTLVLVLRLAERPNAARAASAGLALSAILLFRPGDIAPLALASGLAMIPVLARQTLRQNAAILASAFCAFAAVAAATYALIAATSGFGPDTYYGQSAQVGFEWRLLPLRFVTLVLDPRPLFDGVGAERAEPNQHRGLAEVFIWMLPGLAAGAALCLAKALPSPHLAMMLCYRDLHLLGLWPYGNAHYFKAIQPVLLLLALALPMNRNIRRREWALAAITLFAMTCWRAELQPGAQAPPGTIGDLSHLNSTAIVPATGPWAAFYSGAHRLTLGSANFAHNNDFKLYPRATDVLVIPLRPLPEGTAMLFTDPAVQLKAEPSQQATQTIVFALPCLFGLAGTSICGSAGAPVIP
eukprot:gene14972-15111_t